MRRTNFHRRTITGLLLGAVMIALILLGQLTTQLLLVFICGMCSKELYQMTVTSFSRLQPVVFAMVMTAPVILVAVEQTVPGISVEIIHIVLGLPVAGALYLLFSVRQPASFFVKRLRAVAIGLMFIALPSVLALLVADRSGIIILGVFIILWCSDVSAYMIGSRFGRTKLAPLISPGKTWEGAVAGMIIALLAAGLIGFWLTDLTAVQWMVIGACVVVFGSLGDLLESAIKRANEVKDSGKILPGHGGFFDRFDSFLGCIPWIGLYVLLVAS